MVSGVGTGGVTEYQRQPAIRGMAVVALQGGNEMTGWLAGCCGTVMAAGAGASYLAVVKTGWQPCNGRMAVITLRTGLDMIRCFTGRGCAVMTAEAGTRCNTESYPDQYAV